MLILNHPFSLQLFFSVLSHRFVFKLSNFFKLLVDLVVTGDQFLPPSPVLLKARFSAFSVSSATALLFFGEDLVASSWVESRVLLSSGGAYGRAPLELGF
jgi:hypothetical protein